MYALILAGGRGERLRPITDEIPKPMVPLCEKPILWHQVQWLKTAGVTDIVFFADTAGRRSSGTSVTEAPTTSVRTLALRRRPWKEEGAVRKGIALVPKTESHVIVTNGDTLMGERLDPIVERFRMNRGSDPSHQATIMLVPFVSPYGLIDVNNRDDIEGFREKAELPYWINSGIYVFSREIEEQLPELGDHETSTFPKLASEGKLAGLRSRAFWRGIDSFTDLRETGDHLLGDRRLG